MAPYSRRYLIPMILRSECGANEWKYFPMQIGVIIVIHIPYRSVVTLKNLEGSTFIGSFSSTENWGVGGT